MTKNEARLIAESITNEQLKDMLLRAKSKISNWEMPIGINKRLSKGAAWNLLASRFDVGREYHILTKINLLREFGDYLPHSLRVKKESKKKGGKSFTHQEPNFNEFEAE